jgi:hypothetical protein
MLINLSNHPLAKWSPEQRKAAEQLYGTVQDVPFPSIDPAGSLESVMNLVHETAQNCINLLHRSSEQLHAIHVMGEFTFTYLFVKEMEKRGILCVASTTERLVTDNPDGSKTTVFKFIQFRPYFHAR